MLPASPPWVTFAPRGLRVRGPSSHQRSVPLPPSHSTPLATPQSQVKSSSRPLLVCTQAAENRCLGKYQLPFLSTRFCLNQLVSGFWPHHFPLTALTKATNDRHAARSTVSSQPGSPLTFSSVRHMTTHTLRTPPCPGFPPLAVLSHSPLLLSSCLLTLGTPCPMSELLHPAIPATGFYPELQDLLRAQSTGEASASLGPSSRLHSLPWPPAHPPTWPLKSSHVQNTPLAVSSPVLPDLRPLGLPSLSKGNIPPVEGCKNTGIVPSASQVHTAYQPLP